ncbi:MAG TPA: carbonic anhydrase [Devosiaceae bacterium]
MHEFPKFLIDGYRNFMKERYASERQRRRELAEAGQTPTTMVIGCCDSRAAPETIFDCGPGDLFVLRNVANLVPPYEPDGEFHSTSAAIEFAVNALNIEHIVVMGHGRCGGIKAALSANAAPLSKGDFIGKWMSLLDPVAEQIRPKSLMTDTERQTVLERMSVRHSINNLRTFPDVSSREKEGKLKLHGAWFDISTGELWIMDKKSGDFQRPDA